MSYFVVQVKTGGEEKFLKSAKKALDFNNVAFLWPRKTLRIRRRGKWLEKTAPLYPGYIFLETQSIDNELYWALRKIHGFSHFLRDNHNIEPLSKNDEEIVKHFISYGEIIEKSKATFDENDRIHIISGPLKGLEGLIVKVNRRKGRIKIRLNLYENTFYADLGIELVAPSKDENTYNSDLNSENQK